MPGLENQELWVKEFFYPWGTLPTHLVTPTKWTCDMMGFLTNTFQYVRLPDLKADLFFLRDHLTLPIHSRTHGIF